MPSAISSPSEPVETDSISSEPAFLPSRMIEPLPKLRSICDSAASRAFDLSMDDPSTTRSAALMCFAPYGRDSEGRQRGETCPHYPRWPYLPNGSQHCTRFVPVGKMFFVCPCRVPGYWPLSEWRGPF